MRGDRRTDSPSTRPECRNDCREEPTMSQPQDPAGGLVKTASDMDGVLHLVALVEDIDRWNVVVDGQARDPERSRFVSPYDPRLVGQPCWVIDGAVQIELTIDGRPASVPLVEESRGTTGPDSRPELDWALPTIQSLADQWRMSEHRPTLSDEVSQHWDGLIRWWVQESALPAPSRSGATGRRGSVTVIDGRQVLFVDNSPAQLSGSLRVRCSRIGDRLKPTWSEQSSRRCQLHSPSERPSERWRSSRPCWDHDRTHSPPAGSCTTSNRLGPGGTSRLGNAKKWSNGQCAFFHRPTCSCSLERSPASGRSLRLSTECIYAVDKPGGTVAPAAASTIQSARDLISVSIWAALPCRSSA